MTDRQAEALERLNKGIQESRRTVQQQTLELAQDYFVDSAEELKQQINENRATLESLPDQIPGGREDDAFQAMFQELMDNYSKIKDSLEEARQNVANLNTDQIRRQGEVEATDAARREARERGVDLTKIEGTGADGRIIITDVVEAAEAMEEEVGGEDARGAQEAAGQAVQGAQEAADQTAEQAQQAAGQATDQAGQVVGQATDQVGQVAGQAQEAVGGLTGGGGGPLVGVTDQAGQVVQGVQDTAGQATDQAQQAVGQVTDQAGQAAQQAQDTAGQAAQQGQQAAAGDGAEGPKATSAARRKAQELGVDLSQVRGSGSGGLITIKDVVGS